MRRCGGPSSPAPAPALLLLLLICFFHCAAAAARPLPAAAVPLQVHQENGVRVAADDEPAVLQKGAAGSGDGLSLSVSGVTGAEEDPAAECEEGNDGCLQRRLLRDAHLDYIYTQHKGKP